MSSTALWYTTRASGLTALILLTLTMVMGIATTVRVSTRNWPRFAQQEMHRRISLLAVVFLGIHVLTSVMDTYVHLGLAAVVVPFTSGYDRSWVGVGTVALDLMMAVWLTSLLRARMRPGAWRAVHWLAYLSWPVALAHAFGMGTDAGEGWVLVLGLLCVASVGGAVAWRIRAAGQQARARAAHAGRHGVPDKHLSLAGPTNGGTRHA